MKTYMAASGKVTKSWRLVDAAGKTPGYLASRLALRLRGKDRPEFTPHADTGHYYIVINASKMRITGNKLRDKQFHRHTGYPGGLKSVGLGELMEKNPSQVLEKAVRGMLCRNTLGRKILKNLKVYPHAEHPHTAQKPELIQEL